MATIPKMRNHVNCNFMLARKLRSLMLNNMRWMCTNLHGATLPIQLQSECGSCAAQLDSHGHGQYSVPQLAQQMYMCRDQQPCQQLTEPKISTCNSF